MQAEDVLDREVGEGDRQGEVQTLFFIIYKKCFSFSFISKMLYFTLHKDPYFLFGKLPRHRLEITMQNTHF